MILTRLVLNRFKDCGTGLVLLKLDQMKTERKLRNNLTGAGENILILLPILFLVPG